MKAKRIIVAALVAVGLMVLALGVGAPNAEAAINRVGADYAGGMEASAINRVGAD